MNVSFKMLVLSLLVSAAPFQICRAAGPQLQVTQEGDKLDLNAQLPGSIKTVDLWIESSRNAHISKISDVSPLNPNAKTLTAQAHPNREVWYPVVDVRLEPGMEGSIEFASTPRVCALNSQYFKDALPCTTSLRVPANHLLFWENSLFVEPATASLTHFYLKETVPVVDGKFHFQIKLLTGNWSGKLSLHSGDGAGSELTQVAFESAPVQLAAPPRGEPLSKERLVWSLGATVSYVLRARDENPLSPTYEGINLFYDLDAKTYRSPYWVVGWGPEVSLLIAADKIPGVAKDYAPGELLADADKVGKATLRFVVKDLDNPAIGIPLSRWNRSLDFQYGFDERIAPSDGNWISRWAWLPLYQATGNAAYLDAAKTLAEATEKLVKGNALLPQDYLADRHKWTTLTIDESGWGPEGPSELYRVTKDEKYKQMTKDYIDTHMQKLQREDGLWNRGWDPKDGLLPPMYMTRGMGWVMEGMLAASRAVPEGPYMAIAKKQADHMLEWQTAEGYWPFIATKTVEETGISEKGTALWSYLLYELYRSTHEQKYLDAARKALAWCIRNQYLGPDPEAFGGLVGVTPHSAVGYRQFFPVSCGYTSGFFGMAVVDELQIQGEALPRTKAKREAANRSLRSTKGTHGPT
jgi:rhamnogalacturonyl hydrolase YesR